MKFTLPFTLLLTLTSSALAFPTIRPGQLSDPAALQKLVRGVEELATISTRKSSEPAAEPTLTPDPNDEAHKFIPPGKGDQRGPCPGMNTLANHGYIPRNGIATMKQLIQGQKELFNIGESLGAFLALVATALDGDLISTKVSIGGKDDRTLPLGALQNLISDEPGISGHDHFEGDASLTRADYYLNNEDDFSFQPALYAEMKSFAKQYGNGRYDFNVMSAFREHRYNVSRATNPKFFWGPQSILEYGAASFTYAAFCNATEDATCKSAGESSVSSFYGAEEDPTSPSGFKYVYEKIPPNWYRRAAPYDLVQIGPQMIGMALDRPVQYGFNANGAEVFVDLENPFKGIKLPTNEEEIGGLCCQLFSAGLSVFPQMLGTVPNFLRNRLEFILGAVNPVFQDSCNCGLSYGGATPKNMTLVDEGKKLMHSLLGLL